MAAEPDPTDLDRRTRPIGCLLIGLFVIILLLLMVALFWRSFWWQDRPGYVPPDTTMILPAASGFERSA
jgi:hypothetical protein